MGNTQAFVAHVAPVLEAPSPPLAPPSLPPSPVVVEYCQPAAYVAGTPVDARRQTIDNTTETLLERRGRSPWYRCSGTRQTFRRHSTWLSMASCRSCGFHKWLRSVRTSHLLPPMHQTVRTAVEPPQVQSIGKVVDNLSVAQRQVRETSVLADMPVDVQRQAPMTQKRAPPEPRPKPRGALGREQCGRMVSVSLFRGGG